jgi:hypothetical protein
MNVRSDAVDVEQIMRQIRARIREKRGVDYTEAELQQLARVKLEKFLDPRGLRSDLVEQFRSRRPVSPAPPNFEFEHDTLYDTHRGPLRSLRRLLRPFLKLFFNPDKITAALHVQSQVNAQAEQRLRRLEEREPLNYELLHNLTIELTRLGIEVHNLKMRVESLSSRLDFNERRARSLESVVQYRAVPPRQDSEAPAPSSPDRTAPPIVPGRPESAAAEGGSGGRRRRRRRRRRPGQTLAAADPGSAARSAGQEPTREPGASVPAAEGGAPEAPESSDRPDHAGEADGPDSTDQ